MKIKEKLIFLPRTPEEYDALVDKVCKKFKLEQREHASAVISAAIRRIDNYTATTTLDYLGHAVLKNIANQIAHMKSTLIEHETQINQLASVLEQEPGNQQARDELEKAANEGSKFAKAALEKLQTQDGELVTVTDLGSTQH